MRILKCLHWIVVLLCFVLIAACSSEEDVPTTPPELEKVTQEPTPTESETSSSDTTNNNTDTTTTDNNTDQATTVTPTTEGVAETVTDTLADTTSSVTDTTDITNSSDDTNSETESSDTSSSTTNNTDAENSESQGETVIWDGSLTSFSKSDGSNPTEEDNQDRLSAGVWITRGNNGGQIYNAAVSSNADKTNSPLGTEWAIGSLDQIDDLTFQNFRAAVNNKPKDAVGIDLVLHLTEEDIYLSVRFTSWSSGQRGGFAYQRSTP
ncbi:MAG: hypothetical protein HN591_02485 [Flavobacteriales bacterium]|jgi:cytoskeletal protein RodZ|nr:hypothetical protein [Flavobacteriales bacterium]